MDGAMGAMGALPSKMGELLNKKYKLDKEAKEDAMFIKSKLEGLHSSLRNVDESDKEARIWANNARELSYDIEDAADIFLAAERTFHITQRTTRGETVAKMKSIRTRVTALLAKHERHGIIATGASHSAPTADFDPPRLAARRIKSRKLIGLKKPTKELIKMLEDRDYVPKHQLKVVSIVGSRGLGKTTLANAVYTKLDTEFDCRAFVYMGQNVDMKRVFKDLLLQLSSDNYGVTAHEQKLSDELKRCLQNKRFIIVIDDMWDTKSWEIIKCSLDNNCGGRVIVTTRFSDIARKAGDVYELRTLSVDNSRKLFYGAICSTKGNSPDNDELARICDKIDLMKCEGVPLAILTIASLLAGKPMNEWFEVYKSNDFDEEDNQCANNIMRKTCLSYYSLPSHLRTCLLYLNIFPEDYCIEKDSLIWKWIAEGFVHSEQGNGLFELGEQYYNELKNRSMIQPLDKYDDKFFFQGCRAHDVALDHIVSMLWEDNFFSIFDMHQQISSESNVRRITIQEKTLESKHQTVMRKMGALRSLNASGCSIGTILPLSTFRVVRVLDLVRCHFMKGCYLEGIGNLLNLRYLGLTGTPIVGLQEEIENLQVLQTLDLRGTGMEELPSAIAQLRQLSCLRADENTRVPDWIRKMISLEDLQLYSVDKSPMFVHKLGRLTRLRALRIGFDSLDERLEQSLVDSLCCLRKMKILEIWCAAPMRTVTDFDLLHPHELRHFSLQGICLSRLPSWTSLAHNLSHLAVAVEDFTEQDMEMLGRLPELSCLNLVVGVGSHSSEDGKHIFASNSVDNVGGLFSKLRLCTTNIPLRFVQQMATSIQVLQFSAKVKSEEDLHLVVGNLGVEHVTIVLDCWGAGADEVEKAEAALRNAADINPNRPTIEVIKENQGCKVPSRILLRGENPRLNTLQTELAKMRANQEFLRRIQLHKELSRVDDELDNLQRELSIGA